MLSTQVFRVARKRPLIVARNFSEETKVHQRVLSEIGIKAKLPEKTQPPKEEKLIVNPDLPSPEREREIFSLFNSFEPTQNKLPPKIQKLKEEWDSVEKYLGERQRHRAEYIKKALDPGPKGILWDDSPNPALIKFEELKSYQRHNERRAKNQYQVPVEKIPKHLGEPVDSSEIKYYPGSAYGPGIEDDPEHWGEWFVQNQPPSISKNSTEPWQPQDSIPEEEKETIPIKVIPDPVKIFLTTEFDIEKFKNFKPDEEFFERTEEVEMYSSYPAQKDLEDLPPVPPELPISREEIYATLDNWQTFRSIPMIPRMIQKEKEIIKDTTEELKEIPLPSPVNYYEMLPNYYKEHRLVQSVTTILEHRKPEVNRKHKEFFLNRLCNMLTPKDPKKYLFLQEYFVKKKMPDLSDLKVGEKIAKEEEEEEEEVPETLDHKEPESEIQKAEAELRRILGEEVEEGQSEVLKFDEIQDYGVDWFTENYENPDGKIPSFVNFYDNEDGYWDEWIKHKRERNGLPEMTKRPFFRH